MVAWHDLDGPQGNRGLGEPFIQHKSRLPAVWATRAGRQSEPTMHSFRKGSNADNTKSNNDGNSSDDINSTNNNYMNDNDDNKKIYNDNHNDW